MASLVPVMDLNRQKVGIFQLLLQMDPYVLVDTRWSDVRMPPMLREQPTVEMQLGTHPDRVKVSALRWDAEKWWARARMCGEVWDVGSPWEAVSRIWVKSPLQGASVTFPILQPAKTTTSPVRIAPVLKLFEGGQ